jgi:hypothetical protein
MKNKYPPMLNKSDFINEPQKVLWNSTKKTLIACVIFHFFVELLTGVSEPVLGVTFTYIIARYFCKTRIISNKVTENPILNTVWVYAVIFIIRIVIGSILQLILL